MSIRTSPFRFPFPRRFLIRLHRDLFLIEEHSRSQRNTPSELTALEKMVLISEDRRFFCHNGADWISLMRETLKAASFRRFGGASTIDMQLVRTATGHYERTLRRKIYEIILSILLQYKYTKIEILRNYLDCAFLGSGLYGVEKASQRVFGKDAQSLFDPEAAVIASMLVYPRPRIPTEQWEEKIKRRSEYIMSLYPRLKQRFEKLPSWDAV